MKTNYKILLFTFCVNILMAISLNSFNASHLYLPAMFLYFASNVVGFLDKASYYNDFDLKIERNISLTCFGLSLPPIFLYIANSINGIDIVFKEVNDTYRIIVQAVPDSFLTFDSKDVTPYILFLVFIMPFAYIPLVAIPYLREQGFTRESMVKITTEHPKILLLLISLSLLFGILGIVICNIKYNRCCVGYGSPQHIKYFASISAISFIIMYVIFLRLYKNKSN